MPDSVVIKYPEGRYEGEVNANGEPEGQGVLEYPGNDEHERMIYEGEFKWENTQNLPKFNHVFLIKTDLRLLGLRKHTEKESWSGEKETNTMESGPMVWGTGKELIYPK